MVLSSSTRREKGKRRSGSLIVRFLDLFVLLLCSTPGYAHAVPQEQQKESLGSLSSIGEVYVNDSAAPVESTIFSGDRLRTGESGTATFTVSGKGTLKVLPRSEVVFPGNYQFTAELKNGTVVLSSVSGPRSALEVRLVRLWRGLRTGPAVWRGPGRWPSGPRRAAR